MPLNLTEEQILRLAPDEASVKAGKGLATPGKWILRECSDRCVWGLCQGSGKNPYQTAIDLNDIAFKCSCPSRKFPCKHGLGLLLLYARQPDLFQQAEESEWVKTWLAKRTEKAEKKEQKAKSEKPVDEAAQAKRQEKRHQNVLNGISDLETWMKDILRNGLLNLPERAYTLFDNMARRMIDAQAPGLATRLKEIQEIDFSSENWRSELTDKLGELYLLIRAYRNLERLSDEWRDEIRSQVGYTQPKETVLANEPVADSWLVLHKRSQKINDINTDIYWFYGNRSGRFAKFLSFVAPGAIPSENWLPDSVYEGQLCFYKGTGNCRRALFKEVPVLSQETFVPAFQADLEAAAVSYRLAIRENPFAEDIPLLVGNVAVIRNGNGFNLLDQTGHAVPLKITEETYIDILAITGGAPFYTFLLANDDIWELKSIWYKTKYHTWKDEHN